MSTATTVEPPAVKKRGRPKKVIAEDAETTPVVAEAKKTAAVKVSTKAVPKPKDAEAKKKTVAKSTKAAVKKKEDAPKAITTPTQATPITPTTSKILEKVRATGTLKSSAAAPATPPTIERASPSVDKAVASKPQASPSPAPAPKTLPSQPTPATPTSSTPIPAEKPHVAAAPTRPTAIPPTPAPPSQTPPTTTTPAAAAASQPPPSSPPHQRTTTIPLPREPTRAPSPHILQKPHLTFARPAPAGPRPPPPPPPPPPPHSERYPPYARSRHNANSRVIEPTIDMKLPAKYKPAARRITAIMVGIPIIIVVGWEIYSRWKRGSWEGKKRGPKDTVLFMK